MFEIIWTYTGNSAVFQNSLRFKNEDEALDALKLLLAIKTVSSVTLIKNGKRIEFGVEQLPLL